MVKCLVNLAAFKPDRGQKSYQLLEIAAECGHADLVQYFISLGMLDVSGLVFRPKNNHVSWAPSMSLKPLHPKCSCCIQNVKFLV